MSAPCKGCPCSCNDCIFDTKGQSARPEHVVLSKEEYGCVRPDAGALVVHGGSLGMMRGANFHAVTSRGVQFLRDTGNALAARC